MHATIESRHEVSGYISGRAAFSDGRRGDYQVTPNRVVSLRLETTGRPRTTMHCAATGPFRATKRSGALLRALNMAKVEG